MRKNILDLRKERGWTQHDLSVLTGLCQRRISQLETGVRRPRDSEQEKLAKAFDHLVADMEFPLPLTKRNVHPLLKNYRVPPTAAPLPLRNGFSRLSTIREEHYDLITPLEERIASDADWQEFLRRGRSDSRLETLLQLRELNRVAEFCEVATATINFDSHPVVDHDTWKCLAYKLMPALVAPDYLWIPQVPILTPKAYRLDGLLLVRGIFINLEIDGNGHDPRWNETRRRRIGLPTLRLTEADITGDLSLTDILRREGYLKGQAPAV